jgi:hypothetical protein
MKFGTDYTKFVRLNNDGIRVHNQQLHKNFAFAEIDDTNRVYFVPKSIQGYNVKDLYSTDKYAIVGLYAKTAPTRIEVGDQILSYAS